MEGEREKDGRRPALDASGREQGPAAGQSAGAQGRLFLPAAASVKQILRAGCCDWPPRVEMSFMPLRFN